MGRVYEPDRIRVEEEGDYEDALPNEVCDICGCQFREHAPVQGYGWLRRICDGDLVRLR